MRSSIENAGFLRPEAKLGVVVVSDEDDQTPDVDISQPDFVTWLDTFKVDPASTWFHGIVDPGMATEYGDTSIATGGLLANIGNNDWTPFLREVVDLLLVPGATVLPSVPDGAVEAWIVPGDGTEPYRVDPALVTFDPVTNTVVIDPAAIPEGAAGWLLYLPA